MTDYTEFGYDIEKWRLATLRTYHDALQLEWHPDERKAPLIKRLEKWYADLREAEGYNPKDYLEPDFHASQWTVPMLRSVLSQYGIDYGVSPKKPELVILFMDNIDELREKNGMSEGVPSSQQSEDEDMNERMAGIKVSGPRQGSQRTTNGANKSNTRGRTSPGTGPKASRPNTDSASKNKQPTPPHPLFGCPGTSGLPNNLGVPRTGRATRKSTKASNFSSPTSPSPFEDVNRSGFSADTESSSSSQNSQLPCYHQATPNEELMAQHIEHVSRLSATQLRNGNSKAAIETLQACLLYLRAGSQDV